MASLSFFYGPMDCGKSTLALQMMHNLSRAGKHGRVLVSHDRSGKSEITSRIGLSHPADEVTPDLDLYNFCKTEPPLDFVVVDEAQFLAPHQVEELGRAVDYLNVDVYAYGIATDFRSQLFPGAARLFELADTRTLLQVETFCWCGQTGQQNARVIAGQVTTEGSVVAVGDTGATDSSEVAYRVLCRKHYFEKRLA